MNQVKTFCGTILEYYSDTLLIKQDEKEMVLRITPDEAQELAELLCDDLEIECDCSADDFLYVCDECGHIS